MDYDEAYQMFTPRHWVYNTKRCKPARVDPCYEQAVKLDGFSLVLLAHPGLLF